MFGGEGRCGHLSGFGSKIRDGPTTLGHELAAPEDAPSGRGGTAARPAWDGARWVATGGQITLSSARAMARPGWRVKLK